MRLQRFADLHDWTIIGETRIKRDRLGRYYADDVRVAWTQEDGSFTTLTCVDGSTRYVMTSDWAATSRMPVSE